MCFSKLETKNAIAKPDVVSLNNMPDLVMRKIFEECDIRSVMRIRGVCHKLRDYIDTSSFKSNLTSISVIVRPIQIELVFGNFKPEIDENGTQFVIQYCYDYEDKCLMKCKKNGLFSDETKKVLENHNYVDKFCDDLERILRVNSSVLEFFSIRFAYLTDGFTIEVKQRYSWRIFQMFTTIFHRKFEKIIIVSPDDIRKKATKIWKVMGNSFKQRKLKTATLQVHFLHGHLQYVDLLDNLDPRILTKLDIFYWENGEKTIGYGRHIEMEKYDRDLSQWFHKYYTNPKVDPSSELYKWVKEYFI